MDVQCSRAQALRNIGVMPCIVSFYILRREALFAGCRACTSTRAHRPPHQLPWSGTGCPPRRPSCTSPPHISTHGGSVAQPRRCIRLCLLAAHRACICAASLYVCDTSSCLWAGARGPQRATRLWAWPGCQACPAPAGWPQALQTSLGAQASSSVPAMLHPRFKAGPSCGQPHPWRLSCRWASPTLRPQWGPAS